MFNLYATEKLSAIRMVPVSAPQLRRNFCI
jgi:hypothetical protein